MKTSVVVCYRCLCNLPLTFLVPLMTPPFTFSSSFSQDIDLPVLKIRTEQPVAWGFLLSRQHAESSVGLCKLNFCSNRTCHFPQKVDTEGNIHSYWTSSARRFPLHWTQITLIWH
jgi:hypothetical protein